MYDDDNDGGIQWWAEVGQHELEEEQPKKVPAKVEGDQQPLVPVMEEMER